jgi:hypothetical protein
MAEPRHGEDALDDSALPTDLRNQLRKLVEEEVRHALSQQWAKNGATTQESRVGRVLGWLSNGFVLLIFGSLITYLLVPLFQRQYESRLARTELVKDCLSQFLVYANTSWQEYYAVLPLMLESGLTKEQYVQAMQDTKKIKLARYDAFARLEALSVAFRTRGNTEQSTIERALQDYAVRLNTISHAIDSWLRNMYCVKVSCINTSRGSIDVNFEPYGSFLKIQDLLDDTLGREQTVAELFVGEMRRDD